VLEPEMIEQLIGREVGTAFQRYLGVRWANVDDDEASLAVEMALRPELCGPAGSLEGGIVSTLADVAGASAAARALNSMVATEHIAISFLAPGRVGPIRAVGTPLRVGKRDAVVEVRIYDLGKEDRLMAVAILTIRALVGGSFDMTALADP
jgi:uncharacterized protein (TIGR00369 family)